MRKWKSETKKYGQTNDGVKKEEGQRMEKTQEREERVLSAIKSAVKSAN